VKNILTQRDESRGGGGGGGGGYLQKKVRYNLCSWPDIAGMIKSGEK
jgi:hypothetical protein